MRADVAEALNDHAAAVALHAQLLDGLVAADHHAAPGGFAASSRTAEIERFACHDGGRRLAHVHRVRVHHPRHDLLVRADVRRRDVALRPEPVAQSRRVAARHALELRLRHFRRIADHAALRAAKGNVDDRAFPRHPGGQCAHLVQRNLGGKADAALAWPAHRRMQHAIARVDFDLAVVERHGNVDGDFAFGIPHVAVDSLFEVEFLRGDFEAGFGGFVYVQFVLHGGWRFYRHSGFPPTPFYRMALGVRRTHLAPFRKS